MLQETQTNIEFSVDRYICLYLATICLALRQQVVTTSECWASPIVLYFAHNFWGLNVVTCSRVKIDEAGVPRKRMAFSHKHMQHGGPFLIHLAQGKIQYPTEFGTALHSLPCTGRFKHFRIRWTSILCFDRCRIYKVHLAAHMNR